jgi:predicted ATPase
MWIDRLEVENIRSFKKLDLHFSQSVNIFIGENNSGKSTLLKCLYELQAQGVLNQLDLRKDSESGFIRRFLSSENDVPYIKSDLPLLTYKPSDCLIERFFPRNSIQYSTYKARNNPEHSLGTGFQYIQNMSPYNLFYTHLSRRKAFGDYDHRITLELRNSLNTTHLSLPAKIDSICSTSLDTKKDFLETAQEILGFKPNVFTVGDGKGVGIELNANQQIAISSMGEGISHILALLYDLLHADQQIFLIEELENDLHPEALKKLLNLIIEKSSTNQFFISTHSNIVSKILGGEKKTKIFLIETEFENNQIPTSKCIELNSSEQRREALERLGYDLSDYDLWRGWLLLEESSAELFIREYLIPWFVPNLQGKLRTMAANGVNDLEGRFVDFQRLFTFLHLSEVYKNKAWIIADGDEAGKNTISDLKNKFKSWSPENFKNLSKFNFEEYYPQEFQKKFQDINSTKDKPTQRKQKKDLLDEVKGWIQKDEEGAKKEFASSTKEIIDILKDIDKVLSQTSKI